MDIPQAAGARAVLTLGTDLTFRDFAQAAYRMRGIGKGQTLVLFTTPEVQRLVRTQSALGRGDTPEAFDAANAKLAEHEAARARLEEISGWLVINAMAYAALERHILSTRRSPHCYCSSYICAAL